MTAVQSLGCGPVRTANTISEVPDNQALLSFPALYAFRQVVTVRHKRSEMVKMFRKMFQSFWEMFQGNLFVRWLRVVWSDVLTLV